MKLEDLLWQVVQVLIPTLMAGFVWVMAYLKNYIQAKAKNEYLKGALIRLDDAVVTAVTDIQQTIVDALKEAAKDGVITPEEKRLIKEKAILQIKSHIGVKGIGELAKILGIKGDAIDSLIASKIEAQVYAMKQATNAAGAAGDATPFVQPEISPA